MFTLWLCRAGKTMLFVQATGHINIGSTNAVCLGRDYVFVQPIVVKFLEACLNSFPFSLHKQLWTKHILVLVKVIRSKAYRWSHLVFIMCISGNWLQGAICCKIKFPLQTSSLNVLFYIYDKYYEILR